uniref:NADH-ubiquinone oxidoreductase chain 4 n=1 Tax=Doliolum nationalis TaxID=76841 RepID=Q5KT38_DOLNA|nr:NADH dehydrogenase subunit 4 [Doliolum nationalis]
MVHVGLALVWREFMWREAGVSSKVMWMLLTLAGLNFMGTGEVGPSRWFYGLYLDPVGLMFVLLSFIVVHFSALATKGANRALYKEVLFHVSLLLLILMFSTDCVLGYFLLFEASVVPLYFLILYWGGQYEKVLSNYYFLLFSVVTSFPLFMIVCELVNEGNNHFFSFIYGASSGCQHLDLWIGLGVLVAFMAKLPVYGLHSWLPKAHVDAPVGGSMVLAGILLKLGGYGVLRMVQAYSMDLSFLLVLGIWGYMVTAAMCMRLVDYKVVVAYSSVSHMSIAFSGLISYYIWGLTGSFLMMVGHGVVSPLMFYLGNLWYERVGTRGIGNMKGSKMWFSLGALFLLTFLFNIGFPPFMNFFAEVSLFFSVLTSFTTCGALSFFGFCFSGVCWLNIFVMMFHSKKPEGIPNYLNSSEIFVAVSLVIYFLAFSVSLSFL